MKTISSPADFQAALRADRAVLFLFFPWSRQAVATKRAVEAWAQQQAGKNFEIYLLSPDDHPNTWKWLGESLASFPEAEQGHGSMVWLRQGAVVGFVPNAAHVGANGLTRITHECFDLGRSGVTPDSLAPGHQTFDVELLKILCCPETHQELMLAGPPVLKQLNERIATGQWQNRAGRVLGEKVEAGLVRADGKYLYPFRQHIPILLVDEGIALA